MFRRHPLSAAVVSVLASPAVVFGNNITKEGSTDTSIQVDGNQTDIRTGTIKGNSGFNSFGRFEVASGNTVNLHVPSGKDNLVNLVHDAQAQINGTLNGMKSGQIGGNIIFADPHGLVVGSQGVVNVGSLVVTTPTKGEMDAILDSATNASVDGAAMDREVARLMRGDYQSSSDGEIRIEGQVNAEGGINLFAANAVIVDGAELSVSVRDDAWEVFRSAVNVDGLEDPAGAITIGGDTVEVDGRLATLMEQAENQWDDDPGRGDVEIRGSEITVGATGSVVSGEVDNNQAGDIRLHASAIDRCLACDPENTTVETSEVEAPDALNASANRASVTIEAGAVVDARNKADAAKSGDVEITAEAEDVQISGKAATSAQVTVDGDVAGGNVDIKARSLAMTSAGFLENFALDDEDTFVNLYDTFATIDRTGFTGVEDAFDVEADDLTQLQSIQDIVSVSIADADAGVDINGTVTAERDLDIDAHATRHIDNIADGSLESYNAVVPFSFGFSYGELAGETSVNVGSGAVLNVEGDLSLDASSQNTLMQTAAGLNRHDAEGNPLTTTGLAVGIAMADTRTSAEVADGATVTTSASSDVQVRARAEQMFSNEVSFSSIGKGASAAPAIAYANFDSSLSAAFNTDLSRGDDLSVLALNRVLEQRNSAKTKAGSGIADHVQRTFREKHGLKAPYLDFVTKKVNNTFNLASSDNDSGSTGLRLASAMAWADSHHQAKASLGSGGGATVDAGGNVEVVALQNQAELRNHALSTVNSTAKRKDAANIALSVALAYSDTRQDTWAWIGDDSTVTASNIAVGARTEMPLTTALGEVLGNFSKWDSFQSVIQRAKQDVLDAGKAVADLPSQYANASGEGEKLAMAGAISVMNTTTNTEAWAGDGVSLTATATDPTPWSSVLYRELDEDGNQQAVWTAKGRSETDPADREDDQHDWQGGVQIVSESNMERLAVAGNLGALIFGSKSGKGGSVGAALNMANHNSRTLAGMGVNGQVHSASRFDVLADERNLRMMLAPSAGKGKSVAGNGTAIINLVDSDVIAGVDSSTSVQAPVARLQAFHDIGQWSVAGAVAAAENAGVGAGLAVNQVDTDVQSVVGDMTAWRPTRLPGREPGENATWKIDALVVRSETRGQSGAFSIAGAVARSEEDKNEDDTAKSSDEAQGKSEGLFGSLKSAVSPVTEKFGEWKGKLAGYQESGDKKPAESTDVQTEDQSLPVELSAAGSASINIADQRTHAGVADVVIEGYDADPATGQDVDVRALTQMQQYSGSGAGALTMGGKDSSKFSSALSGALSLNWVQGGSTATVDNVEALSLDRLDTTAITGGDHIAFGAGLSVNTSSTDGISVAMSGSVAANQTRTAAEVFDSNFTFVDSEEADRALNIRGYDRTRNLIGGGALAGASGKGGSAGGSVAVGYLANELAAGLTGTNVENAVDVSVESASQSRVLAGALGAAVSGGKGAALAGSGFTVYMANTVEALVDGQNTGAIKTDALSVRAHSVEGLSGFDSLFQAGANASVTDAGLDFEGNVLADLDSDVEVEDENVANEDEEAGVETQSLFDSDLAGEFVVGIAGTLAASGKGSGGGAAGVIYSGSDYSATVRNVKQLEVTGALDVEAENGVETLGVAVGAAGSKSVAMLGSATALVDRGQVSAELTDNTTGENVETGQVNLNALHSGGYYSFAGALAASKSAAGGAAIGITDIENTVESSLRNTDIDTGSDNLNVTASGANVIRSAAVSGAVSKSTAIGGAFSYNRIDGTTTALVKDSTLDASQLTVSSAQPETGASIWSAAGSIAASGSASVGGSIAINLTEGKRETRVENSTLDASGKLVLDSGTANEIYSLAVGGQASQSVAAGGSASFNYINDESLVSVTGSRLAADSVDADVTDGASRIATLAGNINGGGSAAVGGSVAKASIAQQRSISLTDTELDVEGEANFNSRATGEIYSLSVAGSASQSGGVAGAATVGTIESINEVMLDSVHGQAGEVSLTADDQSSIYSFGLAAGIGGTFGGGAASAVNYISNSTDVGITGHALDTNNDPLSLDANRVTLNAKADQTIRTVAAGAGGGGTAGVSGSLAVNVINAGVSSAITEGAQVRAVGNIGLNATNDSRIQAVSGALTIGGSRFGAAGGVGVNVIDSVTEAYISGAQTLVEARGSLADDRLAVGTTDIANAPDVTNWSDASNFNPVTDLERGSEERTGLSVNAASSQQVGSLSAAVSGTVPDPFGSAAMAGVSTTSVLGGRTEARIEDAQINEELLGAGQDVHVSAGSNAYSVGYLFAGALSGSAALSGTLDVTLIDHDTKADVDGADTRAAGDMQVQADSVRSAANFVTGASGAVANGTGTLGVIRLAGLTQARVVGGTTKTGSLDIRANGDSRMSVTSGSVVVGGVSAGGAFSLGLNESEVSALLGDTDENDEDRDTRVNTDGDVTVDANSTTDLLVNSAAGSFTAGGSIAGSANVIAAENITQARVTGATLRGENGGDTRAGSLTVNALDRSDILSNSGTAGVSTSGSTLGASANVVVTNNATRAIVERSDLRTSGKVDLDAVHELDASLITATGGLSPSSAAIGGSFGLLLVGPGAPVQEYSDDTGNDGSVDVDARDELNKGGSGTLSIFDSIGSGDGTALTQRTNVADGADIEGDALDGETETRVNQGTGFAVGNRLEQESQQETRATITDSTVNSTGNVSVDADERLATYNLSGSAQGGSAGLGAAGAMTFLRSAVTAEITNATLEADTVRVKATAGDLGGDRGVDVYSVSGAAGFGAGLGAAVSVGSLENSVNANLGGTITANQSVSDDDSASIDVDAEDALSLRSRADGAAAGAAAAGVSIAVSERDSVIQSKVAANSQLEAPTIHIDSDSSGGSKAWARSATGGLGVALNGAVSVAKDEASVGTVIGDGVNLQGDTSIGSVGSGKVESVAQGASVSLNVSMGASLAFADSERTIETTLGNNVTVNDGDNLTVSAKQKREGDDANVRAESFSATGGAFLGADASLAFVSGTDTTEVDVGSSLTMNDAVLDVGVATDARRESRAHGFAVGGALAAGTAWAETGGGSTTKLTLGDNVALGDGVAMERVNLAIDAHEQYLAESLAGSGGLVSGNASVARQSGADTVSLTIGNGGSIVSDDAGFRSDYRGDFGSHANSINASALGASGAFSRAGLDSSNTLTLGSSALDVANGTSLVAESDVRSIHPGNQSASAAGGGVASGQAVDHKTDLDLDTDVIIQDDAIVRVGFLGGGNSEVPELIIEAVNSLAVQSNASLATGGALAGGGVYSQVEADLNAGVRVGEATLSSRGDITVSTLTRSSVLHDASANTWGGVAATDAEATTNINDNQSITIGDNASLLAWGYLSLAPGLAADWGQENRLSTITTANSLVRGIIAIADATATANQASNASISVGNGASLSAGRDVELTAYNDAISYTVEGMAKGYQAGFIPIEDKDSREGAKEVSSDIRLNGSLKAGVFDRLDIVIDEYGMLSYNEDSAAPFLAVAQKFNPTDLINSADMDAAVAEVVKKGIVDRDVEAWFLDGLFASGGDVILRADTVDGTGDIEARGGPSITVENNSLQYLRLGKVTIPDNPGGNLQFKGVADSVAGSISVTKTGADKGAEISIRNTRTDNLSGADYGAALFQEDEITNESGTVEINVANGAFAALSTLRGRLVSVNVDGPMIVSPQEGSYWFPGNHPMDIWDNYADLPTDARDAVVYAANVYYDDKLDNKNKPLLEDGTDFSDYDGESIILFGGCVPGVYDRNGTDACTKSTAEKYGFGITQILDINGTGDADRQSHVPVVPRWSLDKVADKRSDSGYEGTADWEGSEAIAIDADVIDLNGTMKTGRKTAQGIHLFSAVDDWVEELKLLGVESGRVEIPEIFLSLTAGEVKTLSKAPGDDWSEELTVYYDFARDQVVVDDVKATGGGYLYMKGKVINSTGMGQIDVESGYGHIDIVNESSADLEVNRLDTGSGSVGMVVIADELKDVTAWYRYTQGEGLEKFVAQGTENVSMGSANRQVLSGQSASFSPQSGIRWEWTERADFSRDYDKSKDLSSWIGNWTFEDKRDPWDVSRSGRLVRDTGDSSAYRQETNGRFSGTTAWKGKYTKGCPAELDGKCDNGMLVSSIEKNSDGDDVGIAYWRAAFPTKGYLEVSRSVRADYEIGINFAGFDEGRVKIDNGGDVRLRGNIQNSSGLTDITSREGAILSGDRMIESAEVRLAAEKAIGSSTLPLRLDLAGEGYLDAVSGAEGINLMIDSGAKLNRIHAGEGEGDVFINATDSLLAGIRMGGVAHIEARNLNLSSELGSIGGINNTELLVVDLYEGSNGDGAPRDGILSVNANRDIGIKDRQGDLWVSSVTSELGDARLVAESGRIRDVERRVGGDSVNAETREQIWKRLRLRAEDGGQARARELTIPAFEAKVERAYADYWRLLDSGTVENGELNLSKDGIEHYRTLLAARGQSSDDTAVQDYAAEQYRQATEIFTEAFGNDWRDDDRLAGYREDFSFQASAAQKEQLTENAIWTDSELRRSINVVALEAATTGSTIDIENPNVVARDVTLEAARDIGEVADPLTINYQDLIDGNLSESAVGALAMARTAGDVTLEKNVDGDIVSLSVNQTIPLYVDSAGRFDLLSGGSTFIQGLGNLRIGEIDVAGDVRALTNDNITVAGNAPGLIKVGGDLTLGAAAGSIGNVDGSALELDVAGELLSASASGDIALKWLNGDLGIERIIANGGVLLSVPNGSLYRTVDGLNISGQSIELATGGAIGGPSSALDLRLTSDDGALSATADGPMYLTSHENTLRTSLLDASGGIQLDVTEGFSLLDNASLRIGDDLDLSAATIDFGADASVVVADDADITSSGNLTTGTGFTMDVNGGELQLNAADLALGANNNLEVAGLSRIDADHWQLGIDTRVNAAKLLGITEQLTMAENSRIYGENLVSLEASGDAVLSQVAVGNGDLSIRADGDITRADANRANLASTDTGTLSLIAGGSIGMANAPMLASVPFFDIVKAGTGSLHLNWQGDAQGGRIEAANTLELTTRDGRFEADYLKADGRASLIGDNSDLKIADLQVSGNLDAETSNGNLSLVNADVDGAADIRVNTGNLLMNDADVQALADLTINTGNMNVGSLSAGSELRVTGTGNSNLYLKHTVVGGQATINHGNAGEVVIGQDGDTDWAMEVDETLSLSSGSKATISRAQAGSDMVLEAANHLSADRLKTGGQLNATVDQGDMSVRKADVAGRADFLTANGNMTVREASTGGAMRLEASHSSAGDITFGYPENSDEPIDNNFHLDAGDTLHMLATGNIYGGNARAVNRLDMRAFDLNFGHVTSSALDVFLQAERNVTGARVVAHRDLGIVAGDTLKLDDTRWGGTLSLKAGRDLTVATGGDIDLTGQIEAGRDMEITSHTGFIRADGAKAGNNMSLSAGEDILFDRQLEAGGEMQIDAGGRLEVGEFITAGGNLEIATGEQLQVGDFITAGGSAALTSGQFSVVGQRVNAGESLSWRSGGDLDVSESITAERGTMDIDVNDSLTTRELHAGTRMDVITGGPKLDLERALAGDALTMNVGSRDRTQYTDNGGLSVGEMTGSAITLRAADRVSIDEVRSSDLLDIASTWIDISRGIYTGNQALGLDVRGLNSAAANRVEANLTAERVESNVLYSRNTRIRQDGTYAAFDDAQYIDVLDLETNQARIVMDNTNSAWAGADVQLVELDKAFWLTQDHNWSETNAYVLHRKPTHQVTVPNFTADHNEAEGVDYTGSSASRYIDRIEREFRVAETGVIPAPTMPEINVPDTGSVMLNAVNLDLTPDVADNTEQRPEKGREI
ncbi:leukotoxin LktA family filamentous adhesin [Marinobacter persicus]|nr:leukotoxin LktA family filamentous adhesin [Marinobacter persicus]GHD53762.1 hypothetical protein GCM10008110_27650 [Marinobacter persicus]